jgi:hypothetical protein
VTTEINTDNFVKALLEKNKALFGDARMEAPDEEKPADPPADKPADPPADSEEKPDDKPEEKESKDDDLPEWARKELTSVRAEAANYRTKLREAEAKLSEAKTPEEVAAAISELREQNAKLERTVLVTTVATNHKLPSDLAELLKGETKEELEAHAKVLAKYAPAEKSEPESLGGGLDPSDDNDGEMDPRKLAQRHRRI